MGNRSYVCFMKWKQQVEGLNMQVARWKTKNYFHNSVENHSFLQRFCS